MQKRTPRILRKALAACVAALCLMAFLAPTAFAAEPKRTPLALGKTISVTLYTPPVAAHGPTYSFTAPASGVYQLKISDVLLKQTGSVEIQALDPKGEILGACYFGNYYWDYSDSQGEGCVTFAAKKGAVVIIDLIPSLDSWDDMFGWKPTPPNTLVASFKMLLTQMKATPIAQGKAATVKLTAKAPAALYSFTPSSNGYYSFTSSDSVDCDPCAAFYDGDGKLLKANDDAQVTLMVRDERGRLDERSDFWLGGLDFNISEPLKAGKTYYLLAGEFSDNACEYTLTVSPSTLSFAGGSMDVGFHKSAWLNDLIETCTYDTLVLDADFTLGWLGNPVEGWNRGSQTINIASPDGKYAKDVTFTVDYDFAQWFAVIFCGGWLWLPRTPVLMPGQTILEYWADQILGSLYDIRWEAEYRLSQVADVLDPMGWFHDSYYW